MYTVGTSRRATASAIASSGGSDRSRIGAPMPASRSATPSSTRATASQLGPALEGGPGHRHRAVAVAVGLDHRAQGAGCDSAARSDGVVAHGVEVDVGPGRPPAVSHRRPVAGPCPQPPTSSRRPPGRAGRRPSDPRARPRAPARPCTWAASAAASSGSNATGEHGPDHSRQDVAGAGGGQGRGAGHARAAPGRSGSATAVVGPLTRATAPDDRGQPAGGGDAVRAGVGTHQPGVLAVVRGEHHPGPGLEGVVAARPSRGRTGRRRRPPPAPATRPPAAAPPPPSPRPGPGPARPPPRRSATRPPARPPTSPGGQRHAHRLRGRAARTARRPGTPRRTIPAPDR